MIDALLVFYVEITLFIEATISSRFEELITKIRSLFVFTRKHCSLWVTKHLIFPNLLCLKWPKMPYIPPLPNLLLPLLKNSSLSFITTHDLISETLILTHPHNLMTLSSWSVTMRRIGKNKIGIIIKHNEMISKARTPVWKASHTQNTNKALKTMVIILINKSHWKNDFIFIILTIIHII